MKKLKKFNELLGESEVFRYDDWVNEEESSKGPESDEIKGGLADGKTPQEIADKHGVEVDQINAQIEKGIEVEREHTDDDKLAREIAKDHLWEDPCYYDKLASIENDDDDLIPDDTETPGMLSDGAKE